MNDKRVEAFRNGVLVRRCLTTAYAGAKFYCQIERLFYILLENVNESS